MYHIRVLERHAPTVRCSHSLTSAYTPIDVQPIVISEDGSKTLRGRQHDNDVQPTVVSEDGSKTLRRRQHDNESLPLPVLMDPVLQEARQKYTRPKPRKAYAETEAHREFQRALMKNVHAHALATSVRLCQASRARLPEHFLIRFTAEMPSLENSEGSSEPKSADEGVSRLVKPKLKSPALVTAIDRPKRNCPSSYVLATKKAVDHTYSKKGRSQVLVNDRMVERYAACTGQNMKKASADWHEKTRQAWPDEQKMPNTILAALRRRVVDNIALCAQHQDVPDGSPVLQTLPGGIEDQGENVSEDGASKGTLPRVLYVENTNSHWHGAGEHIEGSEGVLDVVEYDLLKLLGLELCEELKEEHLLEWRDGSKLFLMEHTSSMQTTVALEKLRNYLGADE